ncbi:MarR family transcriptional regulator [Sphingomonas dokdonensis]|uniref:MarR family protein n=1 Tax=Sphingomonas dokdonensis TaxID=344880 RepID=A0A245ZCS9_9SPHN|nr:MarR family transcriptional regulator [Sphingomonas dokdonensis]OWK27505.1 MarR family protein [Sphingomonas dokdonensis]
MSVGSDEKPILERIEKVLAELSRTMGASERSVDAATIPPEATNRSGRSESQPTEKMTRLNTALAWIRARKHRDEAFGDDLFFDPAWSILLELYVHHRQQVATSITSLCQSVKIPPSTGLRWIALLEKRGLVTREADPFDKRRSYARLTPEAVERVERALDNAVTSDRQLGIEIARVIN